MNDECKSGVRIQGTFLGQSIDLTIVEYDVEDGPQPDGPAIPPASDVPPVEPEAPAPSVDGPSDPAPPVTTPDDTPKNPAGNAEQV